jgi:hypothetical protein
MASLNGQTIASSYEQLLHTDTDGGGNGNTLVSIKDGDNGTTFALKLATNKVEIIPGSDDANAFEVSQADGTAVFTVDSSTPSSTFTGDVNFDSNTLFVDASANAVGIGTNSPQNDVSGLHISVAASTDQLYLERTGSGTGRYYLGTSNNSFFIVDDAQTATRLTIDSSGDVGIGTTSPRISTAYGSTNSKYLTVTNGSTGPGILTLSADRSGDGQGIGAIEFANANNADSANNDADGKTIASIVTNLRTSDSNSGDDSGGEILFSTKPEAGSLVERMRITKSGHMYLGGTASGGTPQLYFFNNDTARGFIQASGTSLKLDSDSGFEFHANNGASRIDIDSSGNVGITDSSPSTALTSFGSASRGLSIKNVQPTIALTDTDATGAFWIANVGGISYFQNNVSGATYRFYVESLLALEIENDGVLKSSDGIEFTGSALGGSQTGVSSSGSGGDLLLFTNGSAFARLLSTGRLVASGNTSSTSAINTAHTFYIDQADSAMVIDNESSGNAFGLQVRYSATGHGTSGYFISCYANPSGSLQARFIVAEDGDVTNANNSYGSISDQRVKKDITDANSQWDDIKAVKIRNYKKDEAGDGSVQIGVVAQELEEAGMSGLVDEMEATDIDVENFPNINKGDKIKSVKYSVLYMKAIKALQEAMSKIETLETKVEALENA